MKALLVSLIVLGFSSLYLSILALTTIVKENAKLYREIKVINEKVDKHNLNQLLDREIIEGEMKAIKSI
ncbi:hypothetical protein HAHI6034_11105 [Hathewaya histolytica]|uniref:Uncharacterized protein n=1 Tax=Hathewaya histolytica TaxID=1498 RepID=A0A4U9RA55_HATHI|nr:hypothetical protein [Hathewaya histolytica]VTQ88454.1 Uncharacterised protein [Hathewaya histolytica]